MNKSSLLLFFVAFGAIYSLQARSKDLEQLLFVCKGDKTNNPCKAKGLQSEHFPYKGSAALQAYCEKVAGVPAGGTVFIKQTSSFCTTQYQTEEEYASCKCSFIW